MTECDSRFEFDYEIHHLFIDMYLIGEKFTTANIQIVWQLAPKATIYNNIIA